MGLVVVSMHAFDCIRTMKIAACLLRREAFFKVLFRTEADA